ncbi:Hpt domain-containing protein [Aliidiomarina haloalkalitolerans]|mgnify:FL=1|uniref:Histidine kinase n=1 Tax=Aliidiomarina haloalkalitolerans TaxID=859059 RepID=A0A432VT35_9GAMM|nr:Hpt domain-containing protein [Aliidiomarina haloalkalitolerans]RUO19556.1 histidine kinase [Aliidiomarina haloalkalitolerans]
MNSRNNQAIDWDLINQYRTLLGHDGLNDSIAMLQRVMPDYVVELKAAVVARDERTTRSQAHKIKGSCRSLGLMRVGEVMAWLEKEQWQWQEVDETVAAWPAQFEQDSALLTQG